MSLWNRNYYNGAALAGGFSIAPEVTSANDVPTPQDLLDYARNFVNSGPDGASLLTAIQNGQFGRIPVDEQLRMVGYVMFVDNLKSQLISYQESQGLTRAGHYHSDAHVRLLKNRIRMMMGQYQYHLWAMSPDKSVLAKIRSFIHGAQQSLLYPRVRTAYLTNPNATYEVGAMANRLLPRVGRASRMRIRAPGTWAKPPILLYPSRPYTQAVRSKMSPADFAAARIQRRPKMEVKLEPFAKRRNGGTVTVVPLD